MHPGVAVVVGRRHCRRRRRHRALWSYGKETSDRGTRGSTLFMVRRPRIYSVTLFFRLYAVSMCRDAILAQIFLPW